MSGKTDGMSDVNNLIPLQSLDLLNCLAVPGIFLAVSGILS